MSATLRWSRSLEDGFSAYRIFRAERSSVSASDEEVATILVDMTDYLGYHFHSEEQMMIDHGFPEIGACCAEAAGMSQGRKRASSGRLPARSMAFTPPPQRLCRSIAGSRTPLMLNRLGARGSLDPRRPATDAGAVDGAGAGLRDPGG